MKASLRRLLTFLFFLKIIQICQAQPISNIYADKSISEIVEIEWEFSYHRSDLSFYFSKYPLIAEDLLIHHFDMDFVIDLRTSEQLFFSNQEDVKVIKSRLPDSLLVYDLIDKVVIKNLYTGEIFLNKRKYKKFGFISDGDYPYFLKDTVLYYLENKNQLFAFNPLTKTQVWQKEFPETVFTFQEYDSNYINLTTKSTFYQLDKTNADILWSLPIVAEGESSLNGELNRQDERLYLWAEDFGLNVVNLKTRELESKWLAGRDNADFTMQMIFEGDSIFARTPYNIYCISKTTGEIYWKSEDVGIVSDITLTDNYIFFEQAGKEGMGGVLTALSRKTHQVAFAQFTSEKYPPSDPEKGGDQNQLDLEKILLLEYAYQGRYLLGASRQKVYCFEILD